MHPFGGLPENLAGFCATLRRDHAFHIGPGELLDAGRALDVVNLGDQRAVRNALRPVLAGTRDDAAVFDEAFDRYFFPPPVVDRQDRRAATIRDADASHDGDQRDERARRPESPTSETDDTGQGISAPSAPLDTTGEGEASLLVRASYSPVAVENRDVPALPDVDDPWLQAARTLVRRVHLGLSRRWRAAPKGRRFNLRGTLRASLQTGGEPLEPRWLGRPKRVPRFVVLIDGSRSMSEHAPTALRMASAIARATSRVEVFTFSTSIQRVTSEVRHHLDGIHRLPRLPYAWGGGTSIGACFAEFLHRFGERLIDRNTVVIVVSDGLDVGESATLLAAMRTFRRRAAGIVWLNPLAATPGYEPTALGMRTALPFVTTFDSVTDLASFKRLARTIRVRG